MLEQIPLCSSKIFVYRACFLNRSKLTEPVSLLGRRIMTHSCGVVDPTSPFTCE